MKPIFLAACAAALALSSCNTQKWNEQECDGYNKSVTVTVLSPKKAVPR